MIKLYKSYFASFGFPVLMIFCGGCVSIPPESVDLSKQINIGIAKSQSAHLSTINAFYAQLNKDNDKWVVEVYLPKLISKATIDMADACKKSGDNSEDCYKLNNGDFKKIIAETIEFRDEMQRALTKNRDESVLLINDHYRDLLASNAAVTGLLASAVDVSKATKEAASLASKTTGINLDTDAIEKAINSYLEKAGSEGAKIIDLEEKLSTIVNK